MRHTVHSSAVPLADAELLGYAERFIFETTKVSQLFCHQIIWNMKANTYKDDLAEVVRAIEASDTAFADTASRSRIR